MFFLSCAGGKRELGNQGKLRGKDHLLSGTWNKLQLCSFTDWRETLLNFPTRLYWYWRKCSWSSCLLPNRITLKICKLISLTTCIVHKNKCHSSEWNCNLLNLAYTCNLFFVEQHFSHIVVWPTIGSQSLMGVEDTGDNLLIKDTCILGSFAFY